VGKALLYIKRVLIIYVLGIYSETVPYMWNGANSYFCIWNL